MLAAVRFRNFKALRATALRLEPFNLVIGPNGSGKTSLIQALIRLRTLAALPPMEPANGNPAGPRIEFEFSAPWQEVRVALGCNRDEMVCNTLEVRGPAEGWEMLRKSLRRIRAYLFDHYAMAIPSKRSDGAELASNAGNIAAVLERWRRDAPAALSALESDFARVTAEFIRLEFSSGSDGLVELRAVPEKGEPVPADSLSQGTLYLLAMLALAHDPAPPSIVCLEDADRGIHPRMLREVRDALYRLSHPPADAGREPVQVIATTHSPYLLDLYRNHPEEVVLANKHGREAVFERLSERAGIQELLAESSLGDLWFSGILGGTPDQS